MTTSDPTPRCQGCGAQRETAPTFVGDATMSLCRHCRSGLAAHARYRKVPMSQAEADRRKLKKPKI